MHTKAKNDTIFQLNIAKNITQDFGKYNIMLNSFVMFLWPSWRSAIFLTFLLILVCIDKHPPSYNNPIIKMSLALLFPENT